MELWQASTHWQTIGRLVTVALWMSLACGPSTTAWAMIDNNWSHRIGTIGQQNQSQSEYGGVVDGNPEALACLPLTGTRTCALFSAYSIPATLFANLSAWDDYMQRLLWQQELALQSNCTQTSLQPHFYLQGSMTQLCYHTLLTTYRAYGCGLGGRGGGPPLLCHADCAAFVLRWNQTVGRCDARPGTQAPTALQVDTYCADSLPVGGNASTHCVSGNGGVRHGGDPLAGWRLVGLGLLLVHWFLG